MAAPKFPNTTDKQIIDRETFAYKNGSPSLTAGCAISTPYPVQQPEIVVAGAAVPKAESGHVTVGNTGVITQHGDRPWLFEKPGKK